MIKIALLGSTGSIGCQVLNVVRRHSDKFEIVSLSAGNSKELFLEQVKEFNPKVACLKTEVEGEILQSLNGTEFFFGEDAFIKAIINEADVVVVALVGFTGLIAVMEAIKQGKQIALANKESLVVGGEIVVKDAEDKGIAILPIDSEHSAIWQALNFDRKKDFKKILLTASGGAFKNFAVDDLEFVTAKDALKHPNWNMGAKITIDSATMVNKALEVIEAKWLYNASFEQIEVVVHPQSIIHSMVEFCDSSVIAQLSYPTMEIPIQLALSYPNRLFSDVPSLDFFSIKHLDFERLDEKKYPCFFIAKEAGKKGGIYPCVMNAANEVLVEYFLKDKIKYNDIAYYLNKALDGISQKKVTLETLLETDRETRLKIKKFIGD